MAHPRLQTMRFWLALGVDGLRLDAIPYLCEREGTDNANLPETHAILKTMRRFLDQHYQGRMFLAEVTQTPADIRAYFGEGDKCHMAYHFPLVPRLFLALCQEDRTPITDMLQQTPALPHNQQWALFLRNHDAMGVKMLTDAERERLYQTYAPEPRMLLHTEIRRRLAPLLHGHLGRLQLLHSLPCPCQAHPSSTMGTRSAWAITFSWTIAPGCARRCSGRATATRGFPVPIASGCTPR